MAYELVRTRRCSSIRAQLITNNYKEDSKKLIQIKRRKERNLLRLLMIWLILLMPKLINFTIGYMRINLYLILRLILLRLWRN